MKQLLILSLFLTACASQQLPIKVADQTNDNPYKMDVSAEFVQDYSDDYNVLLQINFKSKDGKWVRIDSAELDLANSEKQPFNIILGKDLIVWAEAKQEEMKIKQQNKSVTTASIAALAGGVILAGVLGDNRLAAAVGSTALIGAVAADEVQNHNSYRKSAQGVAQAPDTHLYTPFVVPSMALVKRWVLINVPTGRIGKVATVKLKTIEGENLTYQIRLVN